LSEDVDGDGWVTKLRGRAFHYNGLDEENAHETMSLIELLICGIL